MTISQRALVDDVACDVVCTGRFYDFFERRDDAWRIVLRQPIYEKDRLDPVDPAATLKLDAAVLLQFPEGYRHLAYIADEDRLHGQARHADVERPGGRAPLRDRRGVARRQAARLVKRQRQILNVPRSSGGKSSSAVSARRQTPCSNA